MSFIRSYNHEHFANEYKIYEISLILKEYRRVAKIILNLQIKSLFQTGKIDKSNQLYKPIKTTLSERYKDVCKRQVDSMLKSYISNRKNDFRFVINNSSLNNDQKKELRIINKFNRWFIKENLLARKIFKHILKNNKFPSVKNINMVLNTKVCKLEPPMDINSKFKYWVKLTSLTPREFIYIPIKENSYFEKQTGSLCNAFQLNFTDNKLDNVVLILNKEKVAKIEDKPTKVISIDIGLKNLITTNQGDIFHKNFINKLTYYDNRIQKLQKELQRRNVKLNDNKRYVKMTKKLREYIKNECNRIINRIIKIHNPKEIIMEHLRFKSFGFSKRLNRLMSNFGLSYIKSKINSIQEETDIKITEVNPAYTSQECRKCGFIDSKNRKQDNFKCLRCGHKCHADVNSTFNIERRSFDTRINIYTNYKKVKQLLLSSIKESDGSGRVTRSCTQHQSKKPFSKTREIKHECQI